MTWSNCGLNNKVLISEWAGAFILYDSFSSDLREYGGDYDNNVGLVNS